MPKVACLASAISELLISTHFFGDWTHFRFKSDPSICLLGKEVAWRILRPQNRAWEPTLQYPLTLRESESSMGQLPVHCTIESFSLKLFLHQNIFTLNRQVRRDDGHELSWPIYDMFLFGILCRSTNTQKKLMKRFIVSFYLLEIGTIV